MNPILADIYSTILPSAPYIIAAYALLWAISVGTANFHNPSVTMEIVDGIQDYMKQYGFTSVNEMVGLVD